MKKFIYVFATFILAVLIYGCVSSDATIKTYINPALNSSKITSVAIFPLRNAFVQTNVSLGTGDMIEINKMFQLEFANKNSKTTIINSVSATELLNQGSLVDPYSNLLTVYTQTGIPNTETLNKIGKYLKVDAIIQGFVIQVAQSDGVYALFGGKRGETKVVVKYVMFSANTGDVLWEATCDGYKGTATTLENAPPISEVIEMIREKIISAMPILSM